MSASPGHGMGTGSENTGDSPGSSGGFVPFSTVGETLYSSDQIAVALSVSHRHVPVEGMRVCRECSWPYPCPERSRAAFVLAYVGEAARDVPGSGPGR